MPQTMVPPASGLGSALIKGYITTKELDQLWTMAEGKGTSLGKVVEEGLHLVVASTGVAAPRRGLRRLRRGRRSGVGQDEIPIVILEDADAELNPRNHP
jgi:hypothetical protein